MENLLNFISNIKPIMMKLHNGEQTTADENAQVVQFYLEVCQVVIATN